MQASRPAEGLFDRRQDGRTGGDESLACVRAPVLRQRCDSTAEFAGAAETGGSAQPVQLGGKCGVLAAIQRGEDARLLLGQVAAQQLAQCLYIGRIAADRAQGRGIVPGHDLRWACRRPTHRVEQRLSSDRLGQRRIEAGPDELGFARMIQFGGQRDGVGTATGGRGVGAQRREPGDAIAIGQMQIQQQQIEPFGRCQLSCAGAIAAGHDRSDVGQHRLQKLPADGFVFQQQYAHDSPRQVVMLARMRGRRATGKAIWRLVGLMLGLTAMPALAWELGARRVVADAVTAIDVRLEAEFADAGLTLRLAVAELRVGAHAIARDLTWHCRIEEQADGPLCRGPLRLAGAAAGELRLVLGANGSVDWRAGPRGARIEFIDYRPDKLSAKRLPLAWLQPLLQTLWPEASISGGELDAQLANTPTSIGGELVWRDAGLDTVDGMIALADARGRSRIDYMSDAQGQRFELQGEWQAGQVLYRAFYADLAGANRIALQLRRGQDGHWRSARLDWRDPQRLDITVDARRPNAAGPPEWTLSATLADLQHVTPRYFDTLLGSLGLPGLRLSGSGRVQASGTAHDLAQLTLDLERVGADDARARFRVDGLSGRATWQRGATPRASQLEWAAAELYGLPLGGGRAELESADAALWLRRPLHLAAFGGQFDLDPLRWQPITGEFAFGLGLEGWDLAALSRAFGWPVFAGRVSGQLPAARYQAGTLQFDGGLDVEVFDGRVRVDALRLERPLGVAPTLSAEIRLDDLDLTPLTAAFGFGTISGRLDGQIRGLRLIDWTPVAFDAALYSDPAYRGPKRISQRAVKDLSAVGGGGLVAGLQQQLLRAFDSFAYRRLGLACRLQDNVCHMEGIAPAAGNGYVMVEGAGLPRITINGFQRRVDWPVLLARLKAASRGEGIVVD